MVQLSVVIITFNEERNLARCLESLAGIADEIVVIDSFSTDGTAEISRKYGAKFIQHAFEGYIGQKNFALTQARFAHILSLDADEALSGTLKESILKVKINWTHDAYEMNRLTNYCGHWIRHGAWYPDRKIRLFVKDKGRWGGTNPHDRYVPVNPSNVARIPGDILHYSYYSIEGHINQGNKFSEIGARAAFLEGKRASFLTLVWRPAFRFIRDFIFLGGFLDGYYGYLIARITAQVTFLKYAKLRELQKHGTSSGAN
ncbi:MAG TPA: glycosyltransferase family 2 protein [Bacteroidia bacterium]|nr:glycosyltransferase family 2 protein [Bacteroidia bacterium]